MYVLLAASTLVHVAVVPFVMVDYLMLARGIIHGPLIDIEAIVHAHRPSERGREMCQQLS